MFKKNLEFVEDIEPAIKLLNLKYHIAYEPECRWLHHEPSNFLLYLRRKFRGGVGLALLEKMRLKKFQIPRNLYIFLFIGISSIILLVVSNPFIVYILPFVAIIGLAALRIKDIRKGLQVSNEPVWFVIFAVLFEYLWWSATFTGYLYGMKMSPQQINSYLKGR